MPVSIDLQRLLVHRSCILGDDSIPTEPVDPALHHYIEAVHALQVSFAYSARLVVCTKKGSIC